MLNISKRWKKLSMWWSTSLGQAFLATEKENLKTLLPSLFGYHFLILGDAVFISCIDQSPISHQVLVYPDTTILKTSHALRSRHDKLPIISDGVDVVYLAHSLEFMKNPHEVLREVFRILIPEGHVIISNFNPWSLWGLWRFFMRFTKRSPWYSASISVTRLKDWLALLGFDVLQMNTYFFRPPISHTKILKALEWLEKWGRWCWPFWGGGYVLLAKKRVITLTPIRPVFETPAKLLVPGGIAPVSSE